MDIADKARLAKLLGMLGSSFDGERANAAAMIQKLAEKHKLTITELIAAAHGSTAKPHPAWEPPQQERPWKAPYGRSGNDGDDLLTKLYLLVSGNWRGLSDWERQFASDVSDRYQRDYELSEKQLAVVNRIIGKAERGGVRWKTKP